MASKVKIKKKSAPVTETVNAEAEEAKSPATVVEETPTKDPTEVLEEASASVPQVAAPVAEPSAPAPEVSAAKDGYVRVIMLREIDPPPVIGKINVGALLGVKRLAEGSEYHVPHQVACVLKDAKAVMVSGL